jgi:hypothetical protein
MFAFRVELIDLSSLGGELAEEAGQAWGDWRVRFLVGNSNVRDLRSVVLSQAYFLRLNSVRKTHAETQTLCVLVDSPITDVRIAQEDALLREVLSPELRARLHIVRWKGRSMSELHPDLVAWLQEQIATAARPLSRGGSSQHAVLAHLIVSWLAGEPPQQVKRIEAAVGATFPTVSKVLGELQNLEVIERTSDRRVALNQFPLDTWRWWLATVGKHRKPVRFVDPTGSARSPEAMAERLMRLDLPGVVIGGVLGARHHYPDLDITGSLRLDLSVASGQSLDFVSRLDAALERSDDPQRKAALVVHTAMRVLPVVRAPDSGPWADPVECLADLHELQLVAQADEMLSHLIRARDARAVDGGLP